MHTNRWEDNKFRVYKMEHDQSNYDHADVLNQMVAQRAVHVTIMRLTKRKCSSLNTGRVAEGVGTLLLLLHKIRWFGFVVRGESPGCRLISTASMLEWLRISSPTTHRGAVRKDGAEIP